jgi:hypothetical protein
MKMQEFRTQIDNKNDAELLDVYCKASSYQSGFINLLSDEIQHRNLDIDGYLDEKFDDELVDYFFNALSTQTILVKLLEAKLVKRDIDIETFLCKKSEKEIVTIYMNTSSKRKTLIKQLEAHIVKRNLSLSNMKLLKSQRENDSVSIFSPSVDPANARIKRNLLICVGMFFWIFITVAGGAGGGLLGMFCFIFILHSVIKTTDITRDIYK